ncbi:hypothetical protein Tco_1014362 [Tanacetum coccineum]
MLNPNQDTGVDAIFGQQAEATSLTDIPVTTIVESSFFAPINRPPTPNPLVIQLQQPPILTPATTPSSLIQNLPDFASLFGFDNRLKTLEDNFSEFRQTNQYADALSSIPGIVDHYLANKMQEAVDVAVQLKNEEAKTSHAVAANLSELELKKILIDKMEANNSINGSDIQRQLYKALVDAYEADKILLDTYGDTVTIKRPRDGVDDDQEPFARTDQGFKRRRSGKEPESTSAPRETTTTTAEKTTTGSKTHKQSASQSAPVEETMQTTDVFEAPAHQEFETGVHDEQAEKEFIESSNLAKHLARRHDPRESFDELIDQYNLTFPLLKSDEPLNNFCEEVNKATTEKLTGSTPKANNDPHDLRQPTTVAPKILKDGKKRRQFYAFAITRESARDVYSKRRIIVVTKVEIVEWQNYKHLDWITVRRDDDTLYKFKEGNFHRLRIQDIEDMLLLLVQGKLTNLNVEERIAFNKLQPTKPDTYRSNLRRKDAYTPYSDPRGFIYENKDKKNRLMRIDELHKFSDGTLNDVRTALNDRLKGIRMYTASDFWSNETKSNAGAMIHQLTKDKDKEDNVGD